MHLILAQIPDASAAFARTLFEFGVAGCMLYWFATSNNTRMKELGQKIDDNTWTNAMISKSQLLSLVALDQLDSAVKKQAEGLLNEINQKYPDRGMADRTR